MARASGICPCGSGANSEILFFFKLQEAFGDYLCFNLSSQIRVGIKKQNKTPKSILWV